MEIKTSLKMLQALFGQSASDENLDPSVRRLAARMTVLTTHVMQVKAKLEAEKTAREAFAAELKGVLETFSEVLRRYPVAAADAEPTAALAPAVGASPAAPVAASDEEDAETKAMLEQLQREGEADKAATLAKEPPAGVTPLRKAGNSSKPKPSPTGAA